MATIISGKLSLHSNQYIPKWLLSSDSLIIILSEKQEWLPFAVYLFTWPCTVMLGILHLLCACHDICQSVLTSSTVCFSPSGTGRFQYENIKMTGWHRNLLIDIFENKKSLFSNA